MFRPSQKLLFRPNPALNRINHSLPLSPRESTQLLNILTTSFRQHLDAEHPQFSPRTDHPAPPYPQSFTSSRRGPSSSGPSHPADRHLHSLLTNPLFNLPPEPGGSTSHTDPMVTFDQAVAKGMMKTRYAHACLSAMKCKIIESSVLNVRDGMRDSGAGLKVLKWLVSSGTANNNEFLRDERFSRLLMEYIVAEGLQEAAWVWIKRALDGCPELSQLPHKEVRTRVQQDTVRPLIILVKAEATGPSLDAAYLCLSRAIGYLKGRSILMMRPYLMPLVWTLVYATIFNPGQPSSESNFESFLSLIPGLTKSTDYQFAHLNVLHPTKPSAELALDFLRKLDVESTSELRQGPKGKDGIRKSQLHIKLCLDTAKLLLETNRFSEAEWVMGFARTHYPKELGVKEKRQLDQAKAEAFSLELLEGLRLA